MGVTPISRPFKAFQCPKEAIMSEYLVLIHEDEKAWQQADPAVHERTLGGHGEFMAANQAQVRGGNRLRPSTAATSIRRNAQGDVVVTDGTFIESKEVLAGYYLIDAVDLDEAIKIASQVPAPFGGVEVRPVWPTDAY
jgi:hypothetical protein